MARPGMDEVRINNAEESVIVILLHDPFGYFSLFELMTERMLTRGEIARMIFQHQRTWIRFHEWVLRIDQCNGCSIGVTVGYCRVEFIASI